jgi:hypothetical protein
MELDAAAEYYGSLWCDVLHCADIQRWAACWVPDSVFTQEICRFSIRLRLHFTHACLFVFSLQLFVTRELTKDMDMDVYNKMIAVQHNPKFAHYFSPLVAN